GFMIFTGRMLLIPTMVSVVPQLIGMIFNTLGGIFGGSGKSVDETPARGRGEEGNRGRGMSAAERIRQRQEQFREQTPLPRPSRDDAPAGLSPQNIPPPAQRGRNL